MATDPKIIAKLSEDLDNLNQVIDDLANNVGGALNSKLAATSQSLNQMIGEFEKGGDITKQLKTNIDKALLASRKLSLDQLSNNAKLVELERNKSTLTRKQYNDRKKVIESEAQSLNLQQQLNDKLLDYLNTASQAAEKEKQLAEEKKKTNVISQASNVAAGIFNKLGLGSLFTFKGILDAVFSVDNEITQMGKTLGISHEAAERMRKSMSAYADTSKDGFINTSRLYKAQEGLVEQLGIAVDFGREEQETFARLTEITGLTAQEAGKLAMFSASTGKSTRSYVSDLRVASMEASRANRIHISDKELLSSVSKLSAGILVKFQGNPKALAAAVVEAKKLGSNLEQIDKIGDSLLNWEQSIENELEAELITGRKINLEKAREAALSGNQLDLTREIADQVGSLADYQNMNVIAQGSLAKAFGLSREEMSEMLMKQEAINKYGDKANELNAEQLDYMEKHGLSADQMLEKIENQRSTQEKFNDLIDKIKGKFAEIAEGPIGKVLSTIVSLLNNSTMLYSILVAVGAIIAGQMVGGIVSFARSLATAIPKMIALATATEGQALAAVTAAEAETLGIATFAIIGGIAAVMAAMSANRPKTMKDGVMAPSGKVLFSGQEGAIKLGANDYVAAGTDLFGGKPKADSNLGLMAAMSDLKNAVVNQKPPVVNVGGNTYLDTEQVGKMVGRQSVTGTEQSKSSYKLA
jgi:hypothetical protein